MRYTLLFAGLTALTAAVPVMPIEHLDDPHDMTYRHHSKFPGNVAMQLEMPAIPMKRHMQTANDMGMDMDMNMDMDFSMTKDDTTTMTENKISSPTTSKRDMPMSMEEGTINNNKGGLPPVPIPFDMVPSYYWFLHHWQVSSKDAEVMTKATMPQKQMLKREEDTGKDNPPFVPFDMMPGIYWFLNHWHGSQSDVEVMTKDMTSKKEMTKRDENDTGKDAPPFMPVDMMPSFFWFLNKWHQGMDHGAKEMATDKNMGMDMGMDKQM